MGMFDPKACGFCFLCKWKNKVPFVWNFIIINYLASDKTSSFQSVAHGVPESPQKAFQGVCEIKNYFRNNTETLSFSSSVSQKVAELLKGCQTQILFQKKNDFFTFLCVSPCTEPSSFF